MSQKLIKEEIIYLLRSIKRPGVDDLIDYMEENEFFTSPCSSQHHLCYPGGLAKHSLNVYMIATEICINTNLEAKKIEYSSIVLTTLLHDIGKAVYHNKPLYMPNILKDGKQSEKKPFERNSATLGIPHEVAALEIISKFIDLTEEEAHAILFHNGLYTAVGREVNGKETPLQMLLHFADMWASRVVEV